MGAFVLMNSILSSYEMATDDCRLKKYSPVVVAMVAQVAICNWASWRRIWLCPRIKLTICGLLAFWILLIHPELQIEQTTGTVALRGGPALFDTDVESTPSS